jgi:murein DD-endopeptidase MepM/ murein hydrolase activator NlpD
MKQALLFVFFCTALAFAAASQKINVFHERQDQTTTIYATNSELYPGSVSITFDLTNMNFSEGNQKIFVIPAQAIKYKIGELKPARPASYKFSYKYQLAMGDVTKSPDKNYVYDLPFKKGSSFRMFQGYNGRFSHAGENSLDFTMPEGTEIVAAREGKVVEVVQNNTQSCPRPECEKYNNYIMILHPDGSFANYVHIKYNGARFKPGDEVKKGDVIAYSGNVGYSSGPHLHFICFTGGFDKWQSFETKFRVDKGDNPVILQEGVTYAKNY